MIALTAINLAILIFGLVQTRSIPAPSVPSVLRARAIELVDERGKIRAQLNVESNEEVVFRMRDAKGTIRVKVGANIDGSGLVLLDDRTEPTVQIRANGAGPSMTLIRKNGQERVLR
jgi:hypothetical protein